MSKQNLMTASLNVNYKLVYCHYSWKLLLKPITNSVATSAYGKKLMYDIMMMVYNGNQDRYAKISGHGYRILAESMKDNLHEIIHPERHILPAYAFLVT